MALISLEESDEAFDRLKDIVELKLSLLNTELIPIADISSTIMNPITHGALTGVSNVPILQNLESLIEMGKQIIIRVPFLPEYNGTEENLMEMAQFMKEHGLQEIHLMPFHQLGKDKYQKLGKTYQLKEILPLKLREDGPEKIADAKLLLEQFGLKVIIGG